MSRSTTQIGADAARALHQHQVAGAHARERRRRPPRRWSRSSRTRVAACRPRPPRRPAPRAGAPPTAISRSSPAARPRAPHVLRAARSACSPSSSISPSTATLRALPVAPATISSARVERRRARVVGVVDQRDAAGQPQHLAAMVRRRAARPARAGDRRRAARRTPAPRPSRRARSTRLPRPSERRRRCRTSPRGVVTRAPRAVEPAIDDVGARARRRRRRSRTSPRGRRNAPTRAMIAASSALATSTSSARRAFEDLRLGVGDRVERREEAEVRVADVGPHADVRLGDARPACGFPRRDSCPVRRPRSPAACRSSSSDSGRPMWLFKFPLLRNTRYRAARNSAVTSFVVVLPALPVIATTFAPDRRRTSRASVLQRARRVVDLDDAAPRIAVRCAPATPAPASTIAPTRPACERVADELGARRTARRESRRTTRRPASVRESIETPADRRRRDRPRTSRPPVAAATSVRRSSGSRLHAVYDTRDPARRRASAARATSTSSNGSTRSPITWYFSWPLPAISTRSPGARLAHRPLDRRLAIDDRQTRRRLRRGCRSAARDPSGMTMPRLISSMIRSGSSRAGCRT